MSGGESARKLSVLEILQFLGKRVPVLKLERIETSYPVFENRSVSLSSGRKLVRDQLSRNAEKKTAESLRENEGETEEEEEEENEEDGDVIFEYEMDFEGVSRNFTIKTELISDGEEDPVDLVNGDILLHEEGENSIRKEVISEKGDSKELVNEETLVLEEENANETEVISENSDREEPENEDVLVLEEEENANRTEVSEGGDTEESEDDSLDLVIEEEKENAYRTEVISEECDNEEPEEDADREQSVNENIFGQKEGGNAFRTEVMSEQYDKGKPIDRVSEDTFVHERKDADNDSSKSVLGNFIEGEQILEKQCGSSMTNTVFEPTCGSNAEEVLDTSITKNGAKKRKSDSNETEVIILDDSDLSGAEDTNSPSTQSATWTKADCISTKSALPETNVIEKVKSSAKRTKYSCKKCVQVFNTKIDFATHKCARSLVPASVNQFLCPKCEKLFPNLTQLKQHVTFCWKGSMNCIICQKVAFGKFALIKHLQEHREDSKGALKSKGKACLVCGSFDWNWDLRKHWQEHADARANMDSNKSNCIECSHCGVLLANNIQYENHIQVHSVPITYNMCETCGLFFEKGSDLEIHVLSHVNSNTVFKCTLCDKIYPFQSHFELHSGRCAKLPKGMHSNKYTQSCLNNYYKNYLKVFNTHGIELAPCIEEIKIFSHMLRLQANELYDNVIIKLRKTHAYSAQKLFSCQICWNSFNGRENFRIHWREHTGYDPNKCMLCSQVFATAMLRLAHMLKAHSLKYICTKCLLVFKSRQEDTSHRLAHSIKTAYFCEICGDGFDEFNRFEYHVFTNHVKGCKGLPMSSLQSADSPTTEESNLNEDKCNTASSSEYSSDVKCVGSTIPVVKQISYPCKPRSGPAQSLSDNAVKLNPKSVKVNATCRALDFHSTENNAVTVTNNLRKGIKASNSNQHYSSTTSINSTESNSHSRNAESLQYSMMSTTSNAAPVVTVTTSSVPNHTKENTYGRNDGNSQYSVTSFTSNAVPVSTVTTSSVPNQTNTNARNAASVVTVTTSCVPNYTVTYTYDGSAVNAHYSISSTPNATPTSSVPNYSTANHYDSNTVNLQYVMSSASNATPIATSTTTSSPNYTIANHYGGNAVNSKYSMMSSASNAAPVTVATTCSASHHSTVNHYGRSAVNAQYSAISSASNAMPTETTLISIPNHPRRNPHSRAIVNVQYSAMSSTPNTVPVASATTSSITNRTIVNPCNREAVNSQYSMTSSVSNARPVKVIVPSVPNILRKNPQNRNAKISQYSSTSSASHSVPVVSATMSASNAIPAAASITSVPNHTRAIPHNRNAVNAQYCVKSSESVPVVSASMSSAINHTKTNPHTRDSVNSQYSLTSSASNAAPVAATITSMPNILRKISRNRNAVNSQYSVASVSNSVPVASVTMSSVTNHSLVNPLNKNSPKSEYSVMSSASSARPVAASIASVPNHPGTNPQNRNAVNAQYCVKSSESAPMVSVTMSSVINHAKTNPHTRNAVNSQYCVMSSASNAAPVVAIISSPTKRNLHNKHDVNSQYSVTHPSSNSVPVLSGILSSAASHNIGNPRNKNALNSECSVISSASNVAPVAVSITSLPNHTKANPHFRNVDNLQYSVMPSASNAAPAVATISSVPNPTRINSHNRNVNSQYSIIPFASNSVPSTTTSSVSNHTIPLSARALNLQPSVASSVPNPTIANVQGGMTVNLQNSVTPSIVKSEQVENVSSVPNCNVVESPENKPGITPIAQLMTMNSAVSYSVALPQLYKCNICSAVSHDLMTMIEHIVTH